MASSVIGKATDATWAGVLHRGHDRAVVDLDGHGCPRRAGVLPNVGQCLLREAMERELHARWELASGCVDVEVNLDSGPIDVPASDPRSATPGWGTRPIVGCVP
jgi:hypothetical protein